METLTEGINKLNEVTNLEKFGIPQAVVMLVLGVLLLFAGYRIKKVAFFIAWFILGFNLMGVLMPFINNSVPDVASNDLFQILLPIGGGVLLALLGFTIEKLCLGGITFVLVMLITIQYFGTNVQTLSIGAVVGVILAGAAVALMKPAIIVATALCGGYALTIGLLSMNLGIDANVFYWPILGGSAALGAIVQFMTSKRVK